MEYVHYTLSGVLIKLLQKKGTIENTKVLVCLDENSKLSFHYEFSGNWSYNSMLIFCETEISLLNFFCHIIWQKITYFCTDFLWFMVQQCTPLFACDLKPIEKELELFSHYQVDVDQSFTNYSHTVNACLFPISKIYDSKGHIYDMHNLLHHSKVEYD